MKEYRITDPTGASAVILPEKGATVISYCVDGQEYLYRDQENLDSDDRPRCGIPFLFPAFSRFPNDTFVWEGNSYPMQIHGFAHTSVWQVLSFEKSHLRLELCANEETLKMYPFHFRVELIFELKDGILNIRQKYENTGSVAMPYAFGFHPYWAVEDASSSEVEINAELEMDTLSQKLVPCHKKTASVVFPKGTTESGAFFMKISSPVTISVAQEKHIRMCYAESFDRLMLWSIKDRGFLCVEPINSSPNGISVGDCYHLDPGMSREAYVSFEVI